MNLEIINQDDETVTDNFSKEIEGFRSSNKNFFVGYVLLDDQGNYHRITKLVINLHNNYVNVHVFEGLSYPENS